MILEDDRVLRFEGVHNFRDYGGYTVAGGGRLKRGMLWRSGQHHGATDADIERIAALGLATVFDLRTEIERTMHPCRRPDDFAGPVHTPEYPAREGAPHVVAAITAKPDDVESARQSMRRNYTKIAFRPELLGIMRPYLAALAEDRGPSLVNCMAGKDRTGIVVAVLHLIVGVHRDDIIADYLLTNKAGNQEARVAAGIGSVSAMRGQLTPEVMAVLMGVEADYLETAFAAIEERHGSTDAYLRDAVGVDDALRERLRAALVE